MSAFWKGRRVLVTGHTGFKGSWLCLWLEQLGATVSGLALPPSTMPSLHALASPWTSQRHVTGDVRDLGAVASCLKSVEPEIIFHLAAQPLVRASYRDPIGTFETNVIGTSNVLQAARSVNSIRAVVAVTTDKVYSNDSRGVPFVESDRLGGSDPYSASKACAELAVKSFRDSYWAKPDAPAVATVRAGNVIGGGDWSEDRLVPDVVRACIAGRPVELRYPDAMRPWQHVLEPLSGYLALAERLVVAPKSAPLALNFGPDTSQNLTVAGAVDALSRALGVERGWVASAEPPPKEDTQLKLDASAAAATLGWRPKLDIAETIAWTAEWYAGWQAGKPARAMTLDQIARYEAIANSTT